MIGLAAFTTAITGAAISTSSVVHAQNNDMVQACKLVGGYVTSQNGGWHCQNGKKANVNFCTAVQILRGLPSSYASFTCVIASNATNWWN